MKEPKRILFISQEIYPYLAEETPIRLFNRKMPELCQANGFETRTFMPKFGEINERRNQLHEVIRLSGMNVIIDDTDHPLLLKVASIQSARIQIYFTDNDDFFKRRRGVVDEKGKEYTDNDERCIFFARSVIETVKKLRWTPDIVVCSGWMSALAPLYLKTTYADTPFFSKAKIVFTLYNQGFKTPFGTKFAQKVLMEGVTTRDLTRIMNKEIDYVDLMRLALQYSDAVVLADSDLPKELQQFIKQEQKPSLSCLTEADYGQCLNFFKGMTE
ncbi:MAG: glycogen/starch synthase [Paludibacteraceae bacterium]|nr:glycogen/starch synthase [Paludibacteraceae bacterium]MBQ9706136.1 glycogen/starch synthase [Paludibacteraceae bacterium]